MAARGPSLITYGQTFLFLEEVLDHADFELGRLRLESGHPFASLGVMPNVRFNYTLTGVTFQLIY